MHAFPLSRREFLAMTAALASNASGESLASEPRSAPGSGLAQGNTRFGLDLFSQLCSERENVFFSPFSVSVALGMTAAGAKGETLKEIQKILHLPDDPTTTNAAFGELLKAVNVSGPAKKRSYQLTTANALWAMKGYPWRPEFVKLCQHDFGAAIEDVDYGLPEAARKTINTWVEKQTHDKIKDLMPQGSIDAATRLVLTNAIYFKGDWLTPFTKAATTQQTFLRLDGTKVTAPLMFQETMFNYGEQAGLQVLELPYAGQDLSMMVLLPRDAAGLAKVEADLMPDTLDRWTKAVRLERVKVYLPRFKVETKYTLNDPLKKLGLRAAFLPSADFSGMQTGSEPFFISLVVHKAFVDVNEEGTEAAAATGIAFRAGSARVVVEPKIFRADRPFLFLIRQNKTGSVLFMGRVTNPGT